VFYKKWMHFFDAFSCKRSTNRSAQQGSYSSMHRQQRQEQYRQQRQQELKTRQQKAGLLGAIGLGKFDSFSARGRQSDALTKQWGFVSMVFLWLIIMLAFTFFITRVGGRQEVLEPASDFCDDLGLLKVAKSNGAKPRFAMADAGQTLMGWGYQLFTDNRIHDSFGDNVSDLWNQCPLFNRISSSHLFLMLPCPSTRLLSASRILFGEIQQASMLRSGKTPATQLSQSVHRL
jgi:preprotein translocase subunit SecG